MTAERDALAEAFIYDWSPDDRDIRSRMHAALAELLAGYEPPGSYARGVADGRAKVEAAVKALADEWERAGLGSDRYCAKELRAVLASHGGASDAACPWCEHVPHGDTDCGEVVGYDHLNGDHECGCDGGASDAAVVQAVNAVQPSKPCKHCGVPVVPRGDSWVHGHGLYRCQSTSVPYGHNAEPIGQPCRADGPNPCLGATYDREARRTADTTEAGS